MSIYVCTIFATVYIADVFNNARTAVKSFSCILELKIFSVYLIKNFQCLSN